MEIKGKAFIVNKNYIEDEEDPIFKLGDRVIAMENCSLPWCVLESAFTGSYVFDDYPYEVVDVMFYLENPIDDYINDMDLAEEDLS